MQLGARSILRRMELSLWATSTRLRLASSAILSLVLSVIVAIAVHRCCEREGVGTARPGLGHVYLNTLVGQPNVFPELDANQVRGFPEYYSICEVFAARAREYLQGRSGTYEVSIIGWCRATGWPFVSKDMHVSLMFDTV